MNFISRWEENVRPEKWITAFFKEISDPIYTRMLEEEKKKAGLEHVTIDLFVPEIFTDASKPQEYEISLVSGVYAITFTRCDITQAQMRAAMEKIKKYTMQE